MNHIFIIAMSLLVSLAASCTKDLEAPIPDKSNNPYVIISLEDPKMETRSFFDDNLAGESWERELHNVTIFIIRQDENDEFITKRIDLSSEEIENKRSQKVTLDGAEEGEEVVVFAFANVVYPAEITELEDIWAYEDALCDITEYNGTFEEVTSGSMRDNGFSMECNTSVVLDKDVTTVAIEFKRHVAKVAIQTSISDNFQNPNYYPGVLRIDNVDIESYKSVYDVSLYYTDTQDSNHSNGLYNNLFYVYHSYMNHFTVNATYDIDGDFSTTEDQHVIEYPFELLGSYGGDVEVLSNHYYRVSITINGLNREDVELTLSVADWEDTADQNVDIG